MGIEGRDRKITKTESSMPVQSRISLITLANLDKFWMSKGKTIRNMSMLVNWSVDLLSEVLDANGELDNIEGGRISRLLEAYRYLEARMLIQPSMRQVL